MTVRIEVMQIRGLQDIADADLRARAERACGKPVATQFVAKIDGIEAGFLSLDHLPDRALAVPYEIFVKRELRSQGLGSALLSAAEELATSCRYRACRISVWPDPDCDRAQLKAWYQKRGYLRVADHTGEYEKPLSLRVV